MRITDPLPNWRSIWPSAVSRACSRSTLGGLAQDAGERRQLRGRPVAERGHGEVQVLPRYDPDTVDAREGLVLREHDRFEGRRGQEESQEETEPLIAFDASRTLHAPL